MDDEPMWAVDRVVALTPGSVITIPETANEFTIKGNHFTSARELKAVRLMMFPLSLTGEAKTWLDELNEGTIKTWDELRTTFISRFFPPALFDRLLGEIRAFSQHENETLTEAWLRMKEMLRNCHGHNLSKGNIIKIFYHGLNETTQEVLNAAAGGIFLYKTPNQAYQLLEDKVLLKLDWDKNQKTKSSLKKNVAFADEGSSNFDTDKIMAQMDAMTMKMDAQYKEFQSRSKQPNLDHNDDNKPMSHEEEAKFMQTFHRTRFYNDYCDYTFIDLKTKLETTTKNHQALIQNLDAKFDRLADKQSAQPSRSLPSNTQPNPKVMMKMRNLHHDPKIKDPKPVKETPIPKPYKPKIPYPQRLRKEKMEAQYGKFLDMIRAIRINVPLVDVLAGMPNYGKFLKELVSNKHKLKQISSNFLSDESYAIIQNKVPPKLGDPKSFLIPCSFSKAFSCNALADLAENMPVEVGKFTFLVDFIILEMEKDSKSFIICRDTLSSILRLHIDVIDEILEEDFDYLLNKGSKILHSIEGTIPEEKFFAEFDGFMAMTADENSESESDTEEPQFEKLTFNTDYKI
ncbi:reverse transcriptase domain-containing protein [Tanacetum coccineum]